MAIWAILHGLDCNRCSAQLQRVRGCKGSKRRILEGFEINQCPLKYVTPIQLVQIEAYRQYKNGFLPEAGGWMAQTMKFIELMSFIDSTYEGMEQREREEHGPTKT